MDKLSICFVSQEYPEETGWGGIGTYTYELAHSLGRAGHQVCVVSRTRQRERVDHEADGVDVYRTLPRLSLNSIPGLWRLNRVWDGYQIAVALRLRTLVRERAIDIIEAPALHGETALFQRLQPRMPVVVRIHSSMQKVMDLNSVPDRLPLRVGRWLERQAVARAHALTAPSNAVVGATRSSLPLRDRRVHVIPNPIDARFQREAAPEPSSDAPIILFVGRLDQLKGAQILCQAMPAIWEAHPTARFVLIGRDGAAPDQGSMRAWIRARVPSQREDQVRFIDHLCRAELAGFYQQATLVVFPSFWESFGYICTEAMSCARPVIATRSGGPEEIIEHGRNGLLIPPGDPQALAGQANALLGDPALRRTIGAAARARALDFDGPVIAARMLDLYAATLARRYPI